MTMQHADRDFQPGQLANDQFMLATVDGFNMLVPRDHIQTFQSVHDLETGDLVRNSIGWIHYARSRLPVYCFSSDFKLSDRMLENRSVCVLLSGMDLSFMCSDIRVLNYPVEQVLPLPECMTCSSTPVEAVCLYKQGMLTKSALLCSRDSIKNFIVAVSR